MRAEDPHDNCYTYNILACSNPEFIANVIRSVKAWLTRSVTRELPTIDENPRSRSPIFILLLYMVFYLPCTVSNSILTLLTTMHKCKAMSVTSKFPINNSTQK